VANNEREKRELLRKVQEMKARLSTRALGPNEPSQPCTMCGKPAWEVRIAGGASLYVCEWCKDEAEQWLAKHGRK
jgi:hypothetical protein